MIVLSCLLYMWGRVIRIKSNSKTAQDEGIEYYNLTVEDCLLLATVLCATDTVAAIAVIK